MPSGGGKGGRLFAQIMGSLCCTKGGAEMTRSMPQTKKRKEADGEPLGEIIANNRKNCLPATRPPVLPTRPLHSRLTTGFGCEHPGEGLGDRKAQGSHGAQPGYAAQRVREACCNNQPGCAMQSWWKQAFWAQERPVLQERSDHCQAIKAGVFGSV